MKFDDWQVSEMETTFPFALHSASRESEDLHDLASMWVIRVIRSKQNLKFKKPAILSFERLTLWEVERTLFARKKLLGLILDAHFDRQKIWECLVG